MPHLMDLSWCQTQFFYFLNVVHTMIQKAKRMFDDPPPSLKCHVEFEWLLHLISRLRCKKSYCSIRFLSDLRFTQESNVIKASIELGRTKRLAHRCRIGKREISYISIIQLLFRRIHCFRKFLLKKKKFQH